MSNKADIWNSLITIGKKVLSHINLSFDGAKHTLHIDIIPIMPQPLIEAPQNTVPAELSAQEAAPITAPVTQASPAGTDQ